MDENLITLLKSKVRFTGEQWDPSTREAKKFMNDDWEHGFKCRDDYRDELISLRTCSSLSGGVLNIRDMVLTG